MSTSTHKETPASVLSSEKSANDNLCVGIKSITISVSDNSSNNSDAKQSEFLNSILAEILKNTRETQKSVKSIENNQKKLTSVVEAQGKKIDNIATTTLKIDKQTSALQDYYGTASKNFHHLVKKFNETPKTSSASAPRNLSVRKPRSSSDPVTSTLKSIDKKVTKSLKIKSRDETVPTEDYSYSDDYNEEADIRQIIEEEISKLAAKAPPSSFQVELTGEQLKNYQITRSRDIEDEFYLWDYGKDGEAPHSVLVCLIKSKDNRSVYCRLLYVKTAVLFSKVATRVEMIDSKFAHFCMKRYFVKNFGSDKHNKINLVCKNTRKDPNKFFNSFMDFHEDYQNNKENLLKDFKWTMRFHSSDKK